MSCNHQSCAGTCEPCRTASDAQKPEPLPVYKCHSCGVLLDELAAVCASCAPISEAFVEWLDEPCGLCNHSREAHGGSGKGPCAVGSPDGTSVCGCLAFAELERALGEIVRCGGGTELSADEPYSARIAATALKEQP